MKRIGLFVLLLSWSAFAVGQAGFKVGYNVGRFPNFPALQSVAWKFNYTRDLDKGLKVPRNGDGLMIAWGFGTHGAFELSWTNRGAVDKLNYNVNGVDSVVKLKYRLNSFGMAGLFPISDNHRLGFSCDFGKFSVLKYRDAASNDTAEWVPLYTDKGALVLGFTLFLDFALLPPDEGFSLHLRPHVQFNWIPMPLEYNDNDYFYRVNNFGFALYAKFGKGGH